MIQSEAAESASETLENNIGKGTRAGWQELRVNKEWSQEKTEEATGYSPGNRVGKRSRRNRSQ